MNIFNFEYENNLLTNKDGTTSRFSAIYGENGKIIHTKKDTYNIVKTEDVNNLATTFIDKGYTVTPFIHKFGEIIGLNIKFLNEKPTIVGEKNYNAIITIPNNGTGSGYISVQEKRLICKNGASRTLENKELSIKVNHIPGYNYYLEVMEKAIISFRDIIKGVEEVDESLNKVKLNEYEVLFELNKWFFNNEMPLSEKESISTLDNFRKILAENPEDLCSIDRYNLLKSCYEKELEYNTKLGLDLSKYTVLSTCTNYLTRRIEKSKSSAPKEIKFQREAKKLKELVVI